MQSIGTHTFEMWITFAIIGATFALYAWERIAIEVISLGVLCVLMVFFTFFPVGMLGVNSLSPEVLLSGFANPALITVLALLVVGQGMVRTGVLDVVARIIMDKCGGHEWLSIMAVLVTVLAVSAFLNNIPVVVIFIPIMQALAERFDLPASKVMMPLSFAAILGGMTTLIGSGSNLLVNSALLGMGEKEFTFFDFTIPGLVLAGAGMVYLLLVAPFVLPKREGMAETLAGGGGGGTTAKATGRQYIAQIKIGEGSKLLGEKSRGGIFSGLGNMTLRMVQRGEEAILPPFEDFTATAGDVLVVAATRTELAGALTHDPEGLYPDLGDDASAGEIPHIGFPIIGETAEIEETAEDGDETPWHGGERVLAEAMIPPASRLIGQTLVQIGFRYKTQCIVLGVQRRSRMIRTRMTDIRLQAGDVLLLQGSPDAVRDLRLNSDVVLIEWSAAALPAVHHARPAALILLGVVGLSATGVVPIVVAALTGASAMVAMGVMNIRQAARAVDSKILTMIPAALAMGAAMHATGGAHFIAGGVTDAFSGAAPAVILSAFFITLVVLTNIISSKAMAVLFTPIAVDLAISLGVSPTAFAVAVVFAANCSFASPIGYQTNLLVMAPGHYKFADFAKTGVPLILVIWLVFSLFVPWYYDI